MTKEIIIQSTKHTANSIIIDFMYNGAWCKTAINSINYLNWLKKEVNMIVHFTNIKELLKNNDILAEYVSYTINTERHPFSYLLEMHQELEGDLLENMEGLQIILSNN